MFAHTFSKENDIEDLDNNVIRLTSTLIGISGTYMFIEYNKGHITKTCPCNIQRFFSEAKIEIFIGKILIILILLLKT